MSDVLVYLALIAFNYVVPGESRNELIDFEATMENDPQLSSLQELMQVVGATP